MQNLRKLFFVALVFALAAVGCKKTDDTGDDTPTTKTCYVTKMDYGTDGYNTIVYNSDHLITSAVEYDENGTATGYVTSFTYSGSKLVELKSIDNGNIDMKIDYVYGSASTPDSAVIYTDNGSGSLDKDGVYALTFSGSKLVKAELVYSYMGQSIAIGKNEYTYTDNNLTELKTYQIGSSMQLELESTVTYEYDSKKNGLHGIGMDFFFFDTDSPFMSANNITKSVYKDSDGNVDQSMSYTNAYEYNDNDYPTKATMSYDDGSSTDITTYTYDCQ
jgi:hypothetical protein